MFAAHRALINVNVISCRILSPREQEMVATTRFLLHNATITFARQAHHPLHALPPIEQTSLIEHPAPAKPEAHQMTDEPNENLSHVKRNINEDSALIVFYVLR